MADKYDEAMEALLAIKDDFEFKLKVRQVWRNPARYPEGCLFQYLSPDGDSCERPDGLFCGCLTQVKITHTRGRDEELGDYAWTDALTKKIWDDGRVPDEPGHITRENLAVFAEYQREADKAFRLTQ